MATAMSSPSVGSTIVPGMRYRNAPAAIEWLCNAFGFEKHLVVPGDNEFSKNMKQPDEIGGAETQSCYVVVPDTDAHYAHAKSAGAQILVDIHDEDYGGRGYACRDLEGHIWYFGSYNPWKV